MHGQPDERVRASEVETFLREHAGPADELAVIVDGDSAALVAFDRDGEPRLYALNVPVIYPPDGFLASLLIKPNGQLRGRPPVVA